MTAKSSWGACLIGFVARNACWPKGAPILAELVLTDDGFVREGMVTEEFDHPSWWFEWELTDEFGMMTYAGGLETGKEEIGFLPTHWLPPPPAPRVD